MNIHTQLELVDNAMLTPLVRKAVQHDEFNLGNWEICPIEGSAGKATGGLYRLVGDGTNQNETLLWSLILKIIVPAGRGLSMVSNTAQLSSESRDDLTHPYNWKREPLVYQSGFLDDLNGCLSAPNCFDVVEQPDGSIWIWMEDLVDVVGEDWPLDRYGLAARHLGTFNGTYLAGKPIPSYPWLSQRFLRHWTTQWASFVDVYHNEQLWQHPMVHGRLPRHVSQHLLQLWEERSIFFDMLESLPQALCHFDTVHANMIACQTSVGQEQTAMIDWGFLGRGAPGEDIAWLVWSKILFRLETLNVNEFEELTLTQYVAGLYDAGWRVNELMVRYGYNTSATFHILLFLTLLFTWLLDEKQYIRLERQYGSVESCIEYIGTLMERLPARIAEVRTLHSSLLART